MAAFIDHTNEQKQRAGGQAMTDHLINRALHALHVEGEQTEHDKTQVADRRIGHKLFDVALHHRNQRAVDDSDHGQGDDQRGGDCGCLGKQRDGKAQKSVGAELEQDTRENHRAGSRRFHVGVGQPGVKRKQRHFDCKSQSENKKQPDLLIEAQLHTVDF